MYEVTFKTNHIEIIFKKMIRGPSLVSLDKIISMYSSIVILIDFSNLQMDHHGYAILESLLMMSSKCLVLVNTEAYVDIILNHTNLTARVFSNKDDLLSSFIA